MLRPTLSLAPTLTRNITSIAPVFHMNRRNRTDLDSDSNSGSVSGTSGALRTKRTRRRIASDDENDEIVDHGQDEHEIQATSVQNGQLQAPDGAIAETFNSFEGTSSDQIRSESDLVWYLVKDLLSFPFLRQSGQLQHCQWSGLQDGHQGWNSKGAAEQRKFFNLARSHYELLVLPALPAPGVELPKLPFAQGVSYIQPCKNPPTSSFSAMPSLLLSFGLDKRFVSDLQGRLQKAASGTRRLQLGAPSML
jgi:hypothetical protein